MQTPEFLAWAIEFPCPLRGELDGSEPERVERQLRAARAVSDARREGRVLEGLCVQPPNGFRISDALAIYGGEAAAGEACGRCPANALAQENPGALAGCYGLVPLPADAASFHAAIEAGIDAAVGGQRWSQAFPATRQRWYGFWQASPLRGELLLAAFQALTSAGIDDRAFRELLRGMSVAYSAGCSLHARLYPPGRVEGPAWRLAPHCPECQAQWPEARSRQCGVCGYAGHPAPEKKRLARGLRPYFPLARLLGEREAAEFLLRYQAFRARRPDQA